MAISYPLSAADWFGALPIAGMTLDPSENVVVDLSGAGEPITDDVAPMLWKGAVTLGRMLASEAGHASVMMDLLRPAGALFWAFDIRRPAPAADPGGLMLGTAAPVIHALPAGNRELALAGLPAGYVLTIGDNLGFSYAGGRVALHRVAEPVRANSNGVTPPFQVSTLIQPGAIVGTPVQLLRPSIPCMRVPGSVVTGDTRARITEGFTFQFSQTLAVIP